ncbi:UDP-N-acetylmuramoyl-L-alanyl-D-glutamate--2,6-diaminopimelate ligase [Bifidobacterium pullorum]|uniref:UDP-N-acetylmuramoyl-L-alanyl-D-glutamate--2, 6-diaminopimelate ligase n=1 Tax=Bifidobacterium pullorum subsp. gallinarum TaxID=78344 RepID=A0A921IY69_9BIFI|nr:UDP-N-acetylmuramoyl-L-alanyl-D-glutamate--2,6-diaminopimelate ligase [Bifidobacterium pullorum]HJG41965.1 UDP-N-acetylmuramoyl-L-alanyl-D-glutamate--2,6-diaminopimelate ligase [Bifidobacterium pullorum subsp. gallinarum]
MPLTLRTAARLLSDHGLLREVIHDDRWMMQVPDDPADDVPFSDITYDTRTVGGGSLLVCKGRFRPEYLDGLDGRGLAAYVADTDYSAVVDAPGLIVDDPRKALSLLSAEFYGRPQDELTVIGITGTKGKTTTAYLTQAILNAHSDGRCALFSSVDNCLDGHTYEESDLTTPESLDAFRMMRQAADNGMHYLVMEVSSQAYKVHRVHGLTFAIGAFLNISPDHISPIEHPTFEDYLHCKRQLITNSKTLVVNADCDHMQLLRQDAAHAGIPVVDFSVHGPDDGHETAHTIAAVADGADPDDFRVTIRDHDAGTFRLRLPGDCNIANAAAAMAIATAAGVPADSPALRAVETVTVPGRMEVLADPDTRTWAIVDYAHNFASVAALLDFVDSRYGADQPYITLVTGAAGNKAIGRRREIVEAAQHRIGRFVFTAEDTDTEPYEDICNDMLRHVTNPDVDARIVVDRVTALTEAIRDARSNPERWDMVLVIGKGHERWIKDRNRHMPYEGDDKVVSRLLSEPLE